MSGSALYNPASIPVSVATLTDLTGLIIPVASEANGSMVWVVAQKSFYQFLLNSGFTTNGTTVLNAQGGIGQWVQQLSSSAIWALQTTWFMDSSLGSDSNDGASLTTPVKTVTEINRRLRVLNPVSYTINVAFNGATSIPSTDNVIFNGTLVPAGSGASATVNLVGTISTTPTSTGTFSATSATNTATNTQATVTDNVTPLGAGQIGLLLTMTSGAANGATAQVQKNLGGGQVQVSDWVLPSTGVLSATPAPGDTYKIDALPTIAASMAWPDSFGKSINQFVSNFVVSPSGGSVTLQSQFTRYTNCRFTVGTASGTPAYFTQFQACASSYGVATTAVGLVVAGSVQIIGGGSVNGNFDVTYEGGILFRNFCVEAGTVRNSTSSKLWGGAYTVFTNTRLGVFDSPAAGVSIKNGLILNINSGAALYGQGNATFGLECDEGGNVSIDNGVTPTITGTTAALQLAGAATAIPALVGGAAVPAASALATWANWTGAPFSRNAFDFQKATGARIINRL